MACVCVCLGGLQVTLFGMYVHEYGYECLPPNAGRAYVQCIDSTPLYGPEQARRLHRPRGPEDRARASGGCSRLQACAHVSGDPLPRRCLRGGSAIARQGGREGRVCVCGLTRGMGGGWGGWGGVA